MNHPSTQLFVFVGVFDPSFLLAVYHAFSNSLDVLFCWCEKRPAIVWRNSRVKLRVTVSATPMAEWEGFATSRPKGKDRNPTSEWEGLQSHDRVGSLAIPRSSVKRLQLHDRVGRDCNPTTKWEVFATTQPSGIWLQTHDRVGGKGLQPHYLLFSSVLCYWEHLIRNFSDYYYYY